MTLSVGGNGTGSIQLSVNNALLSTFNTSNAQSGDEASSVLAKTPVAQSVINQIGAHSNDIRLYTRQSILAANNTASNNNSTQDNSKNDQSNVNFDPTNNRTTTLKNGTNSGPEYDKDSDAKENVENREIADKRERINGAQLKARANLQKSDNDNKEIQEESVQEANTRKKVFVVKNEVQQQQDEKEAEAYAVSQNQANANAEKQALIQEDIEQDQIKIAIARKEQMQASQSKAQDQSTTPPQTETEQTQSTESTFSSQVGSVEQIITSNQTKSSAADETASSSPSKVNQSTQDNANSEANTSSKATATSADVKLFNAIYINNQ